MILPTAYLAPISWYRTLLQEPCEVELWESFEKQSLRNRCRIAGPNGVQTLTVPVVKCEHKQLTRDVRIAYQEKWQHRHWQALVSAYRHSPFFDYYEDYFRPLYDKKFVFLVDLNEAMHEVILQLTGIERHLQYTDCFRGVTYRQEDCPPNRSYYQIFADTQGFQSDLSVADLLFNMGNESEIYLSVRANKLLS